MVWHGEVEREVERPGLPMLQEKRLFRKKELVMERRTRFATAKSTRRVN